MHERMTNFRLTECIDEEMEEPGDGPSQTSQGSEPIGGLTSQKEPSPGAPNLVSEERRRGKRKVMKKKTTKDDEGYLGLCHELSSVSVSQC